MDILNSVVDEVLKSVQQRLTNIEADVASLVDELNAVRQRLDETDAEVVAIGGRTMPRNRRCGASSAGLTPWTSR